MPAPLFARRLGKGLCVAIAALSALVVALAPRSAEAAACCGAGHSLGHYLGMAERAAVSLTIQGEGVYGAWQSTGDYLGNPDGKSEQELRTELDWLVRLRRDLQVGLAVPFLFTTKELGTLSSSGGGVGDARGYGRFDLVRDSEMHLYPGVSLALSITLPTGRSSSSSTDILGTDVTGLGAAEFRPALILEKSWTGVWTASAGASVGFRTHYDQGDGRSVHLAPRWNVFAATGPVWSEGLTLTLGVFHEREGEPNVGGIDQPSSSRARTEALVSAAYDLSARWTAFATVGSDLPIATFGANESTKLTANLGARFVWGNWD